ncbi:VapE domain-containing protein [Hymenobacter sp. B1770]|uniref:VapE domain-containing protein n=1 Tax=Hymenobacter sp. B1770 TaxID=1718788 RepID=UPI003CF6EA70
MITLDSTQLDAGPDVPAPAPTPRPAATPYNGPATDDRADPTGAAAWCYAQHTGKHGPPPAPGEGHNSWLAAYTKFCNESGAPFDDALALALATAPAGHDTAKITATVTGIYHRDAADYGRKPYTKRKPGRPPGRKAVNDGLKAIQAKLAAKGHNLSPEMLAEAVKAAMHAKKDGRTDGGLSVLAGTNGGLGMDQDAAKTVIGGVQSNDALSIQPQRAVTYADIRDAVTAEWGIFYDPGTHIYYYRKAGSDNPNDLIPFDDRSPFLNDLLNDLEENGTKTSKRTLQETLFSSRTYREINYLAAHLDYLAAHYDGEDHYARLLALLKTDDDPLLATVLKKYLLNTVAQGYCSSSTCRNEQVLVLVSTGQGFGKSIFFQNLLWDDQFFASPSAFDAKNKEHLLLMTNHLLICWDEMGQQRKAEADELKNVLSQHVITADKKFQYTAKYPRTASFCGTTNNDAFLKDATGSRRFLPFTVLGKLDIPAYLALDKAQLWGQIVAEYKAGTPYRLTDEENAAISARNEGRFTADTPEDAFIAECVNVTGNPADFVPSSIISARLDEYKDHRKGQGLYRADEVRKKLLQMPGVDKRRDRYDNSKNPLNGLTGIKLIFNGR